MALVVAASLVAAVLFTRGMLQSIERTRTLVQQASAEAATVRRVMDAVKDAETGQRGYLLTMRPGYLDPFWSGQSQLGVALAGLDRVATATPELAGAVAELRELAQRKLAELQLTVSLAQQTGRDAALAVVLTDDGRATMTALRDSSAALLAAIDRRHSALLEEVRERERVSTRAAAATSALAALILGAALVAVLGAQRRLRRARDSLALETVRLSGTISNMRDGVAVFDAAGGLLLWNDRFAELSHASPGGLRPGAKLQEIASSAWAEASGTGWNAAPPAPQVEEHRRGQDVFELWRSPMPDAGQIVMLADITRRTQAEAIARQAQKMEALGQLTGGVAHDFNNLLQVVSANLELMQVRLANDAWLAARLAAALGAVERAARLTRHLLAFARRQPLAPEAIDTGRLLGGMEEMLRRTLGEAIVLRVVVGSGLWSIRADPQQLENALLNLAINARDAMLGGGRLTIEAVNASLDGSYSRDNAEVTPGEYVSIAVTDTGHGMTPDQLDRALEPFFTTKPEGRGTGLGLSMVFGFAKQSQGHFKLYSEPDHGTTARLYLPRSHVAPVAGRVEAEPAQPAQGELVLIVEDDAVVRAAVTTALQGLGYRTLEAPRAAAALALLRDGERPDLLFTDIVMPGRPDARTMAAEAVRMVPHLAVVFTSGYTENSVVHNGQLDPGVILVSKPWRLADLSRRLREALDLARRDTAREISGRHDSGASRRVRVLLVEDEPMVRMTTSDLLADLGHDVVEAATAAEALALMNAQVDLLMTDLGLPDQDGLTLAAAVRARYPTLPVVVASGRQPDVASGHVWLEKPYDQAALRRAMDRALARR